MVSYQSFLVDYWHWFQRKEKAGLGQSSAMVSQHTMPDNSVPDPSVVFAEILGKLAQPDTQMINDLSCVSDRCDQGLRNGLSDKRFHGQGDVLSAKRLHDKLPRESLRYFPSISTATAYLGTD